MDRDQKTINLSRILLVACLAAAFFALNYFKQPQDARTEQVLGMAAENAVHTIDIPKISLQAPLVFSDLADEQAVFSALKLGIVHFSGTTLPGEEGNSYFFGLTAGSPLLARLPELSAGDAVNIHFEGQNFNYLVIDAFVTDPLDVSVLDQETYGRRILTLQTSDPTGGAKGRFIIVAELNP